MPTWLHKLELSDVFHDDDKSFEDKRDAIVERITSSSWYQDRMESSIILKEKDVLLGIVEDLIFASDYDEFDDVWNDFYDWCDAKRVWVETWK